MERRKYRDNTEEFMLCKDLMCQGLKQAFDDVKALPIYEKELKELKREDFLSQARFCSRKCKIDEEIAAGKSAVDFFENQKKGETRLEYYIWSNHLDLEPNYIRRKYYQLKKEVLECER